MRRSRGRPRSHLVILSVILTVGASLAQADPITVQGYTITDLGAGSPTFSTAGNGNGIVIAPNGQSYAFPQTPISLPSAGPGSLANFPLLEAPPVNDPNTYGNPLNAFSNVSNLIVNANGIAVAVDSFGVYGHLSNNEVYFAQHNADGSWGQPVGVWAGTPQIQGSGAVGFGIVGLSNTNEILINNYSNASQSNVALLYNINTHTLTDLFELFNSANVPFNNLVPLAIDNDGRILLGAQPTVNYLDPQHTLLLTPAGVSSEPLVSPVPEPGSLAVMLLAIAAFATYRLREQRRDSYPPKPTEDQ